MFEYLWLIPAAPLWGFFVLVLLGARLPRRIAAAIGIGSVAFSAILTIIIAFKFVFTPPPGSRFIQHLWTWIAVGNFRPEINLRLDALSLVMIFVVTFVGFLIHFYSAAFMEGDEDYHRFFGYMNLFIAAMLVLVLADNLLMLLLGWEGVGLCSYFLIGFWYRNPVNGRAAVKAFVVTRIGDVAFLIAIFVIFTSLGTLNIQEISAKAPQQWAVGSGIAIWAAALLLAGAIGKSAQLPLQVWLPDAMAGPTPVSALIHAATMVAAGVYLVARMNTLFVLAPPIHHLVAIIGVCTILLAGLSALAQEDLKRLLAYSTISQIGYMFLALGVGAWSAAIFHFLSHAFFKSLLFLCAGVIILSLDHETSMFKMGGLRKKLPVVFFTFLVGALTTAGIPPTAGFASKDLILYRVWHMPNGGPLLWVGGVVGVFFTSLYTFRMLFLTFYGESRGEPTRTAGFLMGMPLLVLALFCLLIGVLDWPNILGGFPILSGFLESAMPAAPLPEVSLGQEAIIEVISIGTGLFGLFVAWLLFLVRPNQIQQLADTKPIRLFRQFLLSGWGFDWAYNYLFVSPFIWVTRKNRRDIIDRFYDGVARMMENLHGFLSQTQNGNLRWYALSIVVGAVFLIGVVIFS